jgi:hypothetical protein
MLPGVAETRSRHRVGRYLIIGRVGRGGMGMVYRALDETLEREVALKTLTIEGTLDAESRRRFEVEAKAAAKLGHPNIVIVYELNEDRGVPFIAMEMLPGADLEAVLRSGEDLPLAEKLDVVVQVCRGLAYAHEHGIVHRDIKPSNIRLLDDGTVKIMDFGIAKLGATHLTKTGMMVGTVNYMSPEQVRGKPLDGRSDVFSVGVILYELLAGERPFKGEGATQVLYKIAHDEPAAPDLSSLGEVGLRLNAVLVRALAKDPEARYPGAAALAEDLSSILEDARGAESTPPAVGEVLVAARRSLSEGRTDEAVTRLRGLVAEHPTLVDARRTLRAALREQRKRLEPGSREPDAFPELDATFREEPTRREPDTALQPTVSVTRPVGERSAAGPVSRRGWLLTGAGLLAVAALSVGVLFRGATPPAATEARIPVRSQPMGATVLVDGRASGVVTNGELVLPAPLPRQVVLTFRKAGHGDETRTISLPLSGTEGVSVTLQADETAWSVATRPPGASVLVDGERVAGTTPLDVQLDPRAAHKLSIELDGYETRVVELAVGDDRRALDLVLEKLPPPGAVVVSSPYPVDVYWGGRPLARGEISPRVQVSAGRQVLTLVAPTIFLRADVAVQVPSGGQATLDAPGLGRVNVRANPDNCEVFIDGAFLDYPPILDRPIVAGRHTVSFRWPDGARSEESVEVKPGAPSFVVGRKE